MALLGTALLAACALADDAQTASKPMKETSTPPEQITAPETLDSAAWQERLSPAQYQILRQAATEPPNGDVYHQFKKQGAGTYFCAGCGTPLFSSDHKFDSRCGWPSFWDPATIDSITTKPDYSHGRVRTEVVCGTCDGHLGHLFEGEGFDTPTDQRYCINGTVLIFVPDPAPEAAE